MRNLFMTEIIIIRAVMHLGDYPMKKFRRLVTQRRKLRVSVRKGSGKISFLTIPPHSQ